MLRLRAGTCGVWGGLGGASGRKVDLDSAPFVKVGPGELSVHVSRRIIPRGKKGSGGFSEERARIGCHSGGDKRTSPNEMKTSEEGQRNKYKKKSNKFCFVLFHSGKRHFKM